MAKYNKVETRPLMAKKRFTRIEKLMIGVFFIQIVNLLIISYPYYKNILIQYGLTTN